jgi:hypothetical protein
MAIRNACDYPSGIADHALPLLLIAQGSSMKLILTLLGVILLVVAAVYFLMPADQVAGLFSGPRGWRDAGAYQARHRFGRGRCRAIGRRRVDGKTVSGEGST